MNNWIPTRLRGGWSAWASLPLEFRLGNNGCYPYGFQPNICFQENCSRPKCGMGSYIFEEGDAFSPQSDKGEKNTLGYCRHARVMSGGGH